MRGKGHLINSHSQKRMHFPSKLALRKQDQEVVPRVSKGNGGGRAFGYQTAVLWKLLPVWIWEADTGSLLKIDLKPSFLKRNALSQRGSLHILGEYVSLIGGSASSFFFLPKRFCF